METIRYGRILLGVGLILAIPFFAMLFRVEGWDWDFFDFVAMGILIFCFGFAYEYLAPRVWGGRHRTLVGIIVFTLLALTWAQLAVGIIW
jgi:peptidoglycan/LPS O-acetylase OafA/YrhL